MHNNADVLSCFPTSVTEFEVPSEEQKVQLRSLLNEQGDIMVNCTTKMGSMSLHDNFLSSVCEATLSDRLLCVVFRKLSDQLEDGSDGTYHIFQLVDGLLYHECAGT